MIGKEGVNYEGRYLKLYAEQGTVMALVQPEGSGGGAGSDSSASGADEICRDIHQ